MEIPFVLTLLHHPSWKDLLYREYDKIYFGEDAIITLTDYDKQRLIEKKRGVDKQGRFHKVSSFNDTLLCRFFTCEVFLLLLRKQLINQDLEGKILYWQHTGFNVHSKVRAQNKKEAEQIGKHMIGPILLLSRLSLDEEQGQIVYQ